MKTYDWIVVGAGVIGSALAYELATVGFSVLLLDQAHHPANATRYSYGGIAFWSGTTELTQTLCQEGIERYRTLGDELGADTGFQELDLIMPVAPGRDPEAIALLYRDCAIPPRVISTADACSIEPLLRPESMAGALWVRHGQVDPEGLTQAFQQALLRLGGRFETGTVTELMRQGDRIQGVRTPDTSYTAANVAIAVGGWTRSLLRTAGYPLRVYFSRAELIETPPVELTLRALVTPAEIQRFGMEAEAGKAETDALWDHPGHEVCPPVLDAGVIQLRDGRLRIGQISRALTDLNATVDAAQSEAQLRAGIREGLPALGDVHGQWHTCVVAFSGDRLPLVGAIPGSEGLHVFSGFSNPFALLLPIARRYAGSLTGSPDALIESLSPARFEHQPSLQET